MNLALLCLVLLNYLVAVVPTTPPTTEPSTAPTQPPSLNPTVIPTAVPSLVPTPIPTDIPSIQPTVSFLPTGSPTIEPSTAPSQSPSLLPSAVPTTMSPTAVPTTSSPTVEPSLAPSALPSIAPTELPSVLPTLMPSAVPTLAPSLPPTKLTIVFETTISLQNVSSSTWSSVSEVVLIDSLAETLFISSDQIVFDSTTSRQWASGEYELLPVFKLTLHTSDYYSDLHNATALYGAVTSTMSRSASNGGFVFAVKYYSRLNHENNLLNVTAASFSNSEYTIGESSSSSSKPKLSLQDRIGIWLSITFVATVIFGYCFFYTFCVLLYPKDLDKHLKRFGSGKRRFSGDIEGHPDVNYWLKVYSDELDNLDSLVDQLQELVERGEPEAVDACLIECDEKLSAVTDIQISFYLELRLVRDKETRLRLDAKAKGMEEQYTEIARFVAQVKAGQVQKFESSRKYQEMKQKIDNLEEVMLVSEEIVQEERTRTAEAVGKSISKGRVSSGVLLDMQTELQHNKEENQRMRQMLEEGTGFTSSSGREISEAEAADLSRLQSQLTKALDEIDLIVSENEKFRQDTLAVEQGRDGVIAELVMQKVVNGNIANEIEETKLELHKLRRKAEAIEAQRASAGLPPANLLPISKTNNNNSGNSQIEGGGAAVAGGEDYAGRKLSLDERLAEHQQRRQSMAAGGGAAPPVPPPRRPVSPDFVTPSRPPGSGGSGSGGSGGTYPNSGGSSALPLTSSQLRGPFPPNTGGTVSGTSSSSSATGGGGSSVMMRGFGGGGSSTVGGRGGGAGRGRGNAGATNTNNNSNNNTSSRPSNSGSNRGYNNY